uniref:Uncharacterized protein n=1 Tax=Bubo bubo TaxID=30461 RepID=A0A8C0EUB5_BUBBB
MRLPFVLLENLTLTEEPGETQGQQWTGSPSVCFKGANSKQGYQVAAPAWLPAMGNGTQRDAPGQGQHRRPGNSLGMWGLREVAVMPWSGNRDVKLLCSVVNFAGVAD